MCPAGFSTPSSERQYLAFLSKQHCAKLTSECPPSTILTAFSCDRAPGPEPGSAFGSSLRAGAALPLTPLSLQWTRRERTDSVEVARQGSGCHFKGLRGKPVCTSKPCHFQQHSWTSHSDILIPIFILSAFSNGSGSMRLGERASINPHGLLRVWAPRSSISAEVRRYCLWGEAVCLPQASAGATPNTTWRTKDAPFPPGAQRNSSVVMIGGDKASLAQPTTPAAPESPGGRLRSHGECEAGAEAWVCPWLLV